ncbi:MAG TPA: hypothetical protein VGB37_14565 [Candidatus Lokiarchaeia archaeon]
MVITNYAPIVISVIGVALLLAFSGKIFRDKGIKVKMLVVASLVIAYGLIGVASQLGIISMGGASSFFLTTTGVESSVIPEVVTIASGGAVSLEKLVIDTMKAVSYTKYSNSYTTVSGTLYFFPADANPGDPNTNAVDSITLSSGVGSSTNAILTTNTPYRVVFDGANTYYDKDFGIVKIENLQKSTGTAQFNLGEIITVATLDDMLDESDVTGLVNGQAVNTSGTAELGYTSADSFMYDESVGDQIFYIQPTFSSSTANTELKNPAMCFEFDTTNTPAGTEVTAISSQLISGTDFNIPSDLTEYWTKEQCVLLTNSMKAGTSSTVKLTFTVDETALGTDDLWYLGFDDLGSLRGKDTNLNTGATIDRITFDAQA